MHVIVMKEEPDNKENKEGSKSNVSRELKQCFKECINKNKDEFTGVFLIRDLLNFCKSEDWPNNFLAEGVLLTKVTCCARITQIRKKKDSFRLTIDDGTSAVLCLIKFKPSIPCDRTDNSLLKKLQLRTQQLTNQTSTDFNDTSLGVPVLVTGNLKQYNKNNFIYADLVRRVSDEFFIYFLHNVIKAYAYKRKNMYQ